MLTTPGIFARMGLIPKMHGGLCSESCALKKSLLVQLRLSATHNQKFQPTDRFAARAFCSGTPLSGDKMGIADVVWIDH